MTASSRIPFIPALLTALCLAGCSGRDYTALVDTRTGTDSRFELSYGNTYPSTGLPFAMHLWSPQTGLNNDGWKYVWTAREIRGFTLSHQCSPWTRDYASFSLFPETGEPVFPSKDRGAGFRHEHETARPHYYKVRFDNGITTEMAPTKRCCHFRFSFPSDGKEDGARIIFDRQRMKGEISTGTDEIRGVCKGRHGPSVYFIIRFDTAFEEAREWSAEDGSGFCLSFRAGSKLTAKVGTSYISAEQAEVNLKREIGDNSFSRTRREGRKEWNSLLGRIDVRGGSDEQIRTFYGCLFRASLFSREIYELDSGLTPVHYSPYDGKVHEGYMYADNGFWDSYRAQFPLSNILFPTMQGRYMSSMLDAKDQCGYLPSWTFAFEQGGMIGNHAISLLSDAWAKGIRTFEPERALEAYRHEVFDAKPRHGSNGRIGKEDYWSRGYLPYPEFNYSSARTLEYAYDDWCAWKLAKDAGLEQYAALFEKSMMNYRNVFDPEVGFMRGRGSDGSWTPDFRPGAWGGPFIEGNAWHYNWSVQQDIAGLIGLYGSNEAFVAKMDEMFETKPIIDFGFYGEVYNEMVEMVLADMGQYEHGNQPIHHAAYLYNYAGQPWKTQQKVREIMDKLYNTGPRGYPGDEDQGSMSAWYVLSALGIYSVTPGTSEYVIGSPLFRKAVITMEDGKKFTIEARDNSADNVYIQSASLNGKPLDKNYIDYKDIVRGGSLLFTMGPEPGRSRGTSAEAAPYSVSTEICK